jgi:hypothetical protein
MLNNSSANINSKMSNFINKTKISLMSLKENFAVNIMLIMIVLIIILGLCYMFYMFNGC